MKLGRSLSFVLACALLAGAAQAQATWIVDDDGGPGVHFTDIQPAIDAASAGDVIRVFPGNYSGFTLDKALVIVGQPSGPVSVQGQAIVRDISAPQKVVLSQVTAHRWILKDCTGAILLDRCDSDTHVLPASPGLQSTNCADVRIQQSSYSGPDGYGPGIPGMVGSQSRIQLSDCIALGGKGASGDYGWCSGQPGGAGMEGSSVIHVYRSWLQGGKGGDDKGGFCPGKGADGGDAVQGVSVLAAGQAVHYLKGGNGGYGYYGSGLAGKSISCTGDVRHSGVLVGTVVAAGAVQVPDPADPTLSFKTPQPPVAGQPLRFMVHGPKDAIVTLLVGREPVLVAPTALKERRLVSLDQDRAPVGVIDGSGVLIAKIHLPSTAPHGFTFLAQAELVYPDGETRYTNSLTVILP